MVEWLPVVDEDDVVVGKATREKINRGGLLHREVYVYLLSSSCVFLQRRADRNVWDHSAAGHVKLGESYEDAALRELKEELGVTIGRDELVNLGKRRFRSKVKNGVNYRFATIFLVRVPQRPMFRLNKKEVLDIRCFSLDEIKELLKQRPTPFTSSCKLVLEEVILPLLEH